MGILVISSFKTTLNNGKMLAVFQIRGKVAVAKQRLNSFVNDSEIILHRL